METVAFFRIGTIVSVFRGKETGQEGFARQDSSRCYRTRFGSLLERPTRRPRRYGRYGRYADTPNTRRYGDYADTGEPPTRRYAEDADDTAIRRYRADTRLRPDTPDTPIRPHAGTTPTPPGNTAATTPNTPRITAGDYAILRRSTDTPITPIRPLYRGYAIRRITPTHADHGPDTATRPNIADKRDYADTPNSPSTATSSLRSRLSVHYS